MARYITRRLLLLFPTLIGIITLNFFIVQLAPGGPVDQMIAQLTGQVGGASNRIAGAQSAPTPMEGTTQYAGAVGLDPELIRAIEKQFDQMERRKERQRAKREGFVLPRDNKLEDPEADRLIANLPRRRTDA